MRDISNEMIDWPVYFKDQLIIGNKENNVAIVTLWTNKEIFSKKLDNNKYCIIGNLYYIDGLNYIIRNIFANPIIRYIILCGKDLGKSGELFLRFVRDGVDENNYILGTEIQIDNEISKKDIDLFREKISVIDLIGINNPEKVEERIEQLEKLKEFCEPKIIKARKEEIIDSFPTNASGFMIKEKTVSSAWLSVLQKVMRFGIIKESQYSAKIKEVINMVVVTEENPDNIKIAPYFNFTKKELEEYYPQLMSCEKIDGIKYTYGERLMNFKNINQIESIVEEFKKAPHSRRAIAVTWDPERDSNKEGVPCLVLMQGLVQNKRLHLTVYMRSNDMFGAWPKNCFGFRKIQQEIANKMGVELGTLTTISNSAHIYEYDWKKAQDIVKEYYNPDWHLDPRGYLVIGVFEDKIKMDHYSNKNKKINSYESRSAEELYKKIVDDDVLSSQNHYSYLGFELQKAEIAIKLGIDYVQDSDLKLPDKI